MKLLIINGPNLNMLGIREPDIYGKTTFRSLCEQLSSYCEKKGIDCTLFQSNHEGALVDAIQQAYGTADGIIINPGAYTHTSIALLDALKSVGIPAVEVHVSDPDQREPFRKISYIRAACVHTIKGHGTDGYFEAVDYLKAYIQHERQN